LAFKVRGTVTMTKEELKEHLEGKKILFVDDRFSSIGAYSEILQDNYGVQTASAITLQEALDKLKENSFDLVLIDLNINPLPDDLKNYREQFKSFMLNNGQTLGMWLSEHQPKTPYAYLSALPGDCDTKPANQAEIEIISKSYSLTAFPQKVYEVMRKV
jgi:CheY-like chemotaxis protein